MHDDYALYEMKYRAHCLRLFFFNDTATTEIYTLSLHDALPISVAGGWWPARQAMELPPAATLKGQGAGSERAARGRSEEHTSELQSPCNIVCRLLLEKKKGYVLHISRQPARSLVPIPPCPMHL